MPALSLQPPSLNEVLLLLVFFSPPPLPTVANVFSLSLSLSSSAFVSPSLSFGSLPLPTPLTIFLCSFQLLSLDKRQLASFVVTW